MVFVALSSIRKRTCRYQAPWSTCTVFNTMWPPIAMVTSSVYYHRASITSLLKELGKCCMQSWEIILERNAFSNRYQPETKQDILVGNQSSTYLEFKLKRQGQSNDDGDKKGSFAKLVDSSSSHAQTLYRKTKEFVLHQSLFLIIAGIAGSFWPFASLMLIFHVVPFRLVV